jgi:hypothetical protein
MILAKSNKSTKFILGISILYKTLLQCTMYNVNVQCTMYNIIFVKLIMYHGTDTLFQLQLFTQHITLAMHVECRVIRRFITFEFSSAMNPTIVFNLHFN